MRLVTYETDGQRGVGAIRDGSVLPTGFTDMLEVIDAGAPGLARAAATVRGAAPLARPRLLAPVPRPGKLLFCGVNYASHKEENPAAILPSAPFFFSKLPTSVIASGDPIVIPTPESKVDYEVELAVVVGKRSRALDPAHAMDSVFGYTVVNDVSARDVQFVDAQITLGKGMDTFCPMGPVIVLRDEIPDPTSLELSSQVNDEVRQSESASGMLFPIARLLEFASRNITLEPGDIVSTGTPAGVGHFRRPPTYLRPGDVVSVEVSGIGRLTNPALAGW